ncbi:MAG: hypothetical protein AABX40_08350 [Candidatus Hydrothermarchaeota archaeon]
MQCECGYEIKVEPRNIRLGKGRTRYLLCPRCKKQTEVPYEQVKRFDLLVKR